MPNTQTLIFQWGSIEVLSPVEKEEEIPGVFLCCRSLQKVNTQRKLYPSHSSPFPPVWLSRHRRLESLGGSCEGTVCQVAPGPVSHLPSCRAPAPFPLLRERRGSPGTAKEEQSIYWFVQVNILIRTRLLLSRKRRSYIVIKSHPFNQANEMLHKKKSAKTHLWLQPVNCCCLSDNNTSSFVSVEVAGETCRLSYVTTKPPLPSEVAVTCRRRLQPFLGARGKTRGDEQALVRFVLPRWIKSYF